MKMNDDMARKPQFDWTSPRKPIVESVEATETSIKLRWEDADPKYRIWILAG